MAINNWDYVNFNTSLPNFPSVAIDISRRMRARPQQQLQIQSAPIAQYSPIVRAMELSRMSKQPVQAQQATPAPSGNHFNSLWNFVQKHEGGYSNDKRDPGGETNFGIARNFNPGVDVKNITRDDAMRIFRDKYYTPTGIERMNPGLGFYLGDAAFNQGPGGMREIMKEAIGTTDIDAMNAMDQRKTLEALHKARMNRYKANKNWGIYGRGWTRRADEALAQALSFIEG